LAQMLTTSRRAQCMYQAASIKVTLRDQGSYDKDAFGLIVQWSCFNIHFTDI